ncbi:MAG: efflux RND transporter periplasmic adaptor subunit [Coriobacteriia bacterium]
MSAQRTFRRYRGWIAAGVLTLVAAGAFLLLRQSGAAETATTYQTEAAALGTLSVTVSGTGNLEVDGTTDVYPAMAGTVDELNVAIGDAVTTGTVLFTLDASDAEASTAQALASYRQAQANVAQANAQLVKARNVLTALQVLYADQQDGDSATVTASTITASATSTNPTGDTAATTASTEVTQADIDSAEQDIVTAQASLDSAKAGQSTALIAYENARDNEDNLEVVAPCGGIVYSLDVEEGDSVSAGSTASSSAASTTNTGAQSGTDGAATTGTTTTSGAPLVIAPAQPLCVHLTVNEVDLPALAVGQRVDIEFDALPDITATGKVYDIGDEGSVSSGVVTFDVWVSLDVAAESLRSGMSAAATIVTSVARDALLVPNAAVKSADDGSYYVEVLDASGATTRQVTVETGLASATQTQILSGLAEGDRVITSASSSSDDAETETQGGGIMMPGMGGGGPRG